MAWTEEQWKDFAINQAKLLDPATYKAWSNSSFSTSFANGGQPGGWKQWVVQNADRLGYDIPQDAGPVDTSEFPAPAPGTPKPSATQQDNGSTGFNIPTDVYSTSSSGIDWNNPFVAGLTNAVSDSYLNLGDTVSGMSDTLTDRYNNLIRTSLGPQAFQGTMNDLAANNMLDSSVASDALAKTASNIIPGITDKAFEADLSQIALQSQLPGIGAGLLSLGQQSQTQNPLQPYELMSQLLLAT